MCIPRAVVAEVDALYVAFAEQQPPYKWSPFSVRCTGAECLPQGILYSSSPVVER